MLKVTAAENRLLLDEFARTGSEQAFATLVERYAGLVHSAALRMAAGDSHLAEDVTQLVFSDLAQRAGRLSANVMLGGWLHRHACFVAANVLRTERRRRAREEKAVAMKILENESEERFAQLAPILDAAVNRLGTDDRTAIILRFFEGQDFPQISQALGNTEDAVRMRVNRALEKLRRILMRRGVTLSSGVLATTLTANVVEAVPAGLVASATATAMAGSTAISTLKIIPLITMTKLKAAGIALLCAGLATPIVLQQQANGRLRAELESLRSQKMEASARAMASAPVEVDSNELERLRAEHAELMRLRAQAAAYRQGQSELTNALNEVARLNSLVKAARPRATESEPAPLAAGLKPVAEFQNMGRSRPSHTFETVLWASASQDTNTIAGSITFDDESRPKASAILANAPESVRNQFSSVEQMVAHVMMGATPVLGMRIVDEEPISPEEFRLVSEWQYKDGRVQPNSWRFRESPQGEWQMVIESGMVDKLGRMLTEMSSLAKNPRNQ